MTPYLMKVLDGRDLTFNEATACADQLMVSGENPYKVAGLLVALRAKGESYEEISGFAKGLKNNAVPIAPKRTKFFDIVGTGGDGAHTFNISTTCAFVLAGAGVNVAKHGNRSISSKCGSADVLEALGVNIQASPDNIKRQLDDIGLSFIFAPLAHPSMRNVMEVRKNLGIPTIFNIIGPLSNPIQLEGQCIGVFKPRLVTQMAKSMHQLGVKMGAVIHGAGGLDEASLAGDNTVVFMKKGNLVMGKINGRDFGLCQADNDALIGGDANENAEILLSILNGARGPKRDVVLLNVAIALYAFDLAETIEDGIAQAARSIDEGHAIEKLNKMIEISNEGGVI